MLNHMVASAEILGSDRGLSRRRFLGLLGITPVVIAMAACNPNRGEPTATANTDQPTVWNDSDLPNNPDRGLTSVMIRFDPQHDPVGSVRMETCYDNTGRFRVVSEEVSPRPGPLVDKTFDHKAQCYPEVWPVSPIDVGDVEIVELGVGNTDDDLSNVRAYEVKRTVGQTLEVKPLGTKTIGKPGTLKMRDATP